MKDYAELLMPTLLFYFLFYFRLFMRFLFMYCSLQTITPLIFYCKLHKTYQNVSFNSETENLFIIDVCNNTLCNNVFVIQASSFFPYGSRICVITSKEINRIWSESCISHPADYCTVLTQLPLLLLGSLAEKGIWRVCVFFCKHYLTKT